MRSILPPVLAGLLVLVAAAMATGPRLQRRLGVVIGVASMFLAWLLPPEPPLARGVLALVTFVCTMRVVDLRRGTWSLPARVAHTFSVVDTRVLTRARPRLGFAATLKALAWLATALAAGRGLAALHAARAEPWIARWAIGVVMVYAGVSALYGGLEVGYRAAGWDTPPLHVAPILARSVQEFWGERWARPISRWLGETCFRPWARTRPLTGVLAAFAVSAAFHAYAVWVSLGFVDGLALTAATFAYFVLQGAVMKVERAAGVRRWPAWAGHTWTVVWMLALAPVFVEPILRVLGFPAPAGSVATVSALAVRSVASRRRSSYALTMEARPVCGRRLRGALVRMAAVLGSLLASGCADRKVEATQTTSPEPSASAASAAAVPAVTVDAAPPPTVPEPPPLPARVETLAVTGDLPAALVRASGGAPPRVVFLPGVCSNAAAYLSGFSRAAERAGGIVAIDGDQPCGGAPGFRTFTFDIEKQHRRIEAALTATGLATIPAEGLTVIGYSQGALILEYLAARYPKRYARVVIIAPPSDPVAVRYAATRAVVTMSCSRDVPLRMKTAAKAISALGIPSTYLEMPGCTHGNLADGEATFERAFAWLDEHDARPSTLAPRP